MNDTRSEFLVSVNDYQQALRAAPRAQKKHPDPLALTPAQYAVAMEMSTFADYQDGRNCRPGVDTIASLTKHDRTTVMRVRDELEALGWLELVGERGSRPGSKRTTCYRLTLPTGCTTRLVTGGVTSPVTGGVTQPVQNPTGGTTHTTGRMVHTTGRTMRPDLSRPSMTKKKETRIVEGEEVCVWCECPTDRDGSYRDKGKFVICHHGEREAS